MFSYLGGFELRKGVLVTESRNRGKVELDYAYLAEFAQVSNGKITAVGASFTHVSASAFPLHFAVSVAGRIRVSKETETVALSIGVSPESGEYKVDFDGLLSTSGSRPYGEKIGILFALTTQVFVPRPGVYEFKISLEGAPARDLKFQAELN
jgi:hypothetical protein